MNDYPRPSLTADCVILDGSRVLLIKRGKEPYAGRWALPGGFVNRDETVDEAAARELREETGLKLVPGVRAANLKLVGVFSKPGRDPRGWVVSVAYMADVQDESDIRVTAGDDAVGYQWVEVEELDTSALAFDHDEILLKALIRIGRGHLYPHQF